ncbi:hypothetical protein B0H14DRAFT_2571670 [Mycena olivaceomarginata]|nr:hypothetical protein B0H14DRAFT_2571670 [Mycena olivaceomarginata]
MTILTGSQPVSGVLELRLCGTYKLNPLRHKAQNGNKTEEQKNGEGGSETYRYGVTARGHKARSNGAERCKEAGACGRIEENPPPAHPKVAAGADETLPGPAHSTTPNTRRSSTAEAEPCLSSPHLTPRTSTGEGSLTQLVSSGFRNRKRETATRRVVCELESAKSKFVPRIPSSDTPHHLSRLPAKLAPEPRRRTRLLHPAEPCTRATPESKPGAG